VYQSHADPVLDRDAVLSTAPGQSRTAIGISIVTGLVLASGPVSSALGLPPLLGLGLPLGFAAWIACVHLFIAPRASGDVRWFHAAAAGNAFFANVVTVGLAAGTRDPRTLVWCLHVLYAAQNGSLESGPIHWLLALHVLAPLVAIPLLPETADGRLGGPLLVSVAAGIAYLLMSFQVLRRRAVLEERDKALARVREQQQELSRMRLARDLHDSVGSALAVLHLYADQLERTAGNAAETRELAARMRDTASDGLGDLRGALDSLAPGDVTLDTLARALRRLATRLPADVRVETEGPSSHLVVGDLRLAVVRVFQEAVRNAIQHGHARTVRVRLTLDDTLALAVHDDGRGFDTSHVPPGRGLAGLRTRAAELGGTFSVSSAPGQGTHIDVRLPTAPARAATPRSIQ